jgi:putative membrane protein
MILWLKAFHLIAVIAWMAGLLYLPRLYVYHAGTTPGSPESELFKVMERRLLRAIMNPAMILVFVLGAALIVENPDYMKQGWLHAKLALVLVMAGIHGMLSKYRKDFANDRNVHSARFYRILNEGPTLLLIGIVILAVVQPF